MDRRAEWTTAALAAVMLTALAPVGLASSEAVDAAAQALGVRRSLPEQAPVADLFARMAVLLPLGEVGARPHAVAVAFGALALALLVVRLRLSAPAPMMPPAPSTATPTGPLPSPRTPPGGGLAHVVAVAVAVALVGVSRPFIEVACLRPARATDLASLIALGTMLEMVRRDSARSSLGLTLAFVAGLAAGAGGPVRAATWPLALGCTGWALRRGWRWPLLAPFVFVAGTGVVFGAVASADPMTANSARALWGRFILPWVAPPGLIMTTWAPALRAAAGDLGMLVALVSVLGGGVLLVRAPAQAIFSFSVSALALVAALVEGDVLFARLVVVVALAVPVKVAIQYLAHPFGRARVPAALVVAVIVVLPPAIVGVQSAALHPAWRSPASIARRLDSAAVAPTAARASSSDKEAARWLRYARAVRDLY